MTRDQFNRLLRNPATIDLNFISDLEEITRRFPYFSTAHILLAKQYHGHENIKYESHLRKASAYAPDRSILFHLIKQVPDEVIHIPSPEPEVTDDSSEHFHIPDYTVNDVPEVESPVMTVVKDTASETGAASLSEENVAVNSSNEIADAQFTDQSKENSRQPGPLEIIEQRLRELEKRSKPDDSVAPEVSDNVPEPIQPEVKPPVSSHTETELPIIGQDSGAKSLTLTSARDRSNSGEPGQAQTKSSDHSTVKPSAPVEKSRLKNDEETKSSEKKEQVKTSAPSRTIPEVVITHSFSDWLKIKSIPVIAAENLSEYLLNDQETTVEAQKFDYQPDLIEKFIKNEPRIVAGKSEFYSPGNMARKSAVEHEDLISETLARIYAQQGNIPKAIDAYQRLSLKNPEKSTYFAALIRELEENSQE
jgi:hypothetical protein